MIRQTREKKGKLEAQFGGVGHLFTHILTQGISIRI